MSTLLISASIAFCSALAVFVMKGRKAKSIFVSKGLLIGVLSLFAVAATALYTEGQAFAGENSSAIVVQTGVPINPPDDEGCGD